MSTQEVKITYSGADPTAFGVLGLSLVCFVASSAKLGFTNPKSTALIVVWAALLGGIVQIMAANIDFKKGNVFGGTVLGAYGFFWVGMAFSMAIMNGMLGPGMQAAVDPKMLGVVYVGYLIFSLFITVAAFEVNFPFIVMLVLIDVLFISLAAVSFKMGPVATFAQLAGWSELIISLVGFYASGAIFFKNFYGREILPLGKPWNIIKKATPPSAQTQNLKQAM
ncbi:GPR1/FUN34/YaaH family transporter [Desulfosporosinus sp. BG]|uniref:acetate uptake transporter n=1 Tax=Desulfosporosinus sp. BG TaxID=1633135 RepID=UPI00083AAE3C|nr:GPR1/FUN34/YaaH family transporter [Desulfosporosinus sp. BG]ODA39882.1 putative regulatory protein [Desulfosporosinus sp. BG]